MTVQATIDAFLELRRMALRDVVDKGEGWQMAYLRRVLELAASTQWGPEMDAETIQHFIKQTESHIVESVVRKMTEQ